MCIRDSRLTYPSSFSSFDRVFHVCPKECEWFYVTGVNVCVPSLDEKKHLFACFFTTEFSYNI